MTAVASGARRSGVILFLVSLALGLGIAFAAAASIISANGPGDSGAIGTGPAAPLPASQLLGYGG